MKVIDTKLDGLYIIKPVVYSDERGYFFESYRDDIFKKKIGNINFIQENESYSTKGILRGLHFQTEPYAQAKLVRCIKGKVLDVVVDIRKKSKTFGKYKSFLLSEHNKLQLFIPKGFAHGFIVLSNEAIFSYKVDNLYHPENDSGILWCDKDLNINWVLEKKDIIVSQKDSKLKSLREL